MASFNAMSYNCNGIGDKNKRLKIFNYISDKIHNGFCFLQECHSTPGSVDKWTKEWGGDIFFSHGTSNSTGVAICFSKRFNMDVIKVSADNKGRILILEISCNDTKYLLINLYNANTEADQLVTLDTLNELLDGHDIDGECHPIFGGDFNLIFDVLLDASGGNPTLKKRSVAKILNIIEKMDACDIFRIRYPDAKRFTFRQKTPLRQRRLDYLFVANNLQEFVATIKILPSFLSDHSPIIAKIDTVQSQQRGSYGWKFNCSLLNDPIFVRKQKENIANVISSYDGSFDPHLKWELLKYEMRKFCISYSKQKSLEKNSLKDKHEQVILNYDSTDNNRPSELEYTESKHFLENLIQERTKGAILRSKCQWYEEGEKSSKFFMNLEKKNSVNNSLKKIIVNRDNVDIEITDKNDILGNIHEFYSNLFKRTSDKTDDQCDIFLRDIDVPNISNQHMLLCENDISLDELKNTLFSMTNGKTPGNDGLSVEFYRTFWENLKSTLHSSVQYSFQVGKLSISQRQAIIKLLEKRDKDKRFISNWRPISLLNVDTKIISKCLAARLIPILPTIISSDQTAYVSGRFIGESTRLISDILEVSDIEKLDGYILTADLEKAFDSIDHTFLISCLKKYGFGPNFLSWVKILLNQNESCVMNCGTTTKYFNLDRGARQGDPIAAYFFILVLEIFFIMIRSNNSIHKLKIFDFMYILSAYADDTTFFVSDLNSIFEIDRVFKVFSKFSGLKLNTSKCEICGIGAKKGDLVALCGFKNVDLTRNSIRILGVHFSYNKNICHQRNFVDVIKKIENVIKVWKMRNLTLLGKITIFKSLAISKIVYISYLSNVPPEIIAHLELIHKQFIWCNKRPKIKHSTLISDYCDGGLKDIDIKSKIDALHLSWIKRLYDNNFHPWKIIPHFYFKKVSKCQNTVFYPNLCITVPHKLPLFYKNLILKWSTISQSEPITVSSILSESIWYNSHLKIDLRPIEPSFLKSSDHLFIRDLLDVNGDLLSWDIFREKYNLGTAMQFKWIQLRNCIPSEWLKSVKTDLLSYQNLVNFRPHLNDKARIISSDKLTSSELYKIGIRKIIKPPSSQSFFNNKFDISHLWKKIYLLPRYTTIDTYSRIFQYKILNNILFLNDKLFHSHLVPSPLCSLCLLENESIEHLFCNCHVSKTLWDALKLHFGNNFILEDLTPQSATIGFLGDTTIMNHILLIFKIFLYKNRSSNPTLISLVAKIKNVSVIEKQLCFTDRQRNFYNQKWGSILNTL